MNNHSWPDGTDDLLDEILTDAYGDDEQLRALLGAFEDGVELAADGFVVGEPISILEINYDGTPRRGLAALCRGRDGVEHVVGAADAVFLEGSDGARHIAAYRKWMGPDLLPAAAPTRWTLCRCVCETSGRGIRVSTTGVRTTTRSIAGPR